MATKKKTTKKKTAPATKKKTTKNEAWFETGKAGYEKKASQDKAAETRRERNMQRVYLKAGEEAIIVFLPDMIQAAGFFVSEHNLKLNGKFHNYFTCVKDFDTCQICTGGDNSVYTCYFYVLDCRGFTKKDGTQVKAQPALFGAKGPLIHQIRDLSQKLGGMAGKVFKVKRYTAKESNTGTHIELISKKKPDLAKKFGKEILAEIKKKQPDYKKLFAPPSKEDIEVLGVGSVTIGSEEDLGAGFDDNEHLDW